MSAFDLISDFKPTGDQPQAIDHLARGIKSGLKQQALLGVTGSGKSVVASTPILVRRGRQTSFESIGPMIDELLAARSEEVQGVADTELLEPHPLDEPVEVFSFDPHTGRPSWKSVRQFLRHRSPDRLSRVTTRCGRRVTVTGDHNFFVLRQGALELVQTDEIRPGDYLPIPRGLPEPAEPLETLILAEQLPVRDRAYVRLADLEKHWVARRADLQPLISARQAFGVVKLQERVSLETYRQLVRIEPTIAAGATLGSIKRTYSAPAEVPITPSLMRLLGYYIAEGHAEQNYFVLSSAEDTIVTDMQEAVIELGLHIRRRPSTYDYQISSSFWTSLLAGWCGRDSRSKRLPSFWPRLSNAALAQLLRAYFAADGGVDGVRVTCITASEQLASDLMYALLRFGIVGRTQRRLKRLPGRDERGEYWQVVISGKESLEKFKEGIGFALPRKNRRLAEIMAPSANTNVDVVPLDGDALRSARKSLGLWQRTLADRAGCARSLLSLIEDGHRRPSRTLGQRLVATLRDEARLQQDDTTLQVVESFSALLDLFWTPVESVESVPGELHVYDVAVADNETFLAGSGGLFVHNTFTMANVVQQIQRPTLVMAHNKTLAAQLASEFKEFFPNNAVEYFVSYYDYYQPEAYMPRTDTYIEKDTLVNEDIERLRHSTMQSLLTRRDVLVVASVSCIYGLGDPEEYGQSSVNLRVGETYKRDKILRRLTDVYYERNDYDLSAGKFRVRGDTLEVHPSSQEIVVRISFWGDEVERITEVDPLTGEVLADRASVEIYPARYFVTSRQKLEAALHDIAAELEERVALFESQDKLLEAQRLRQRTQYDIEMLSETGFCSGVENYSRHLSRREAGSTPWTLMDYFPDDFVAFIDESHMTVPQVRGMFNGDRARKDVLVEFGFRLPSALDNRPLMFNEFEERLGQTIFVSATPGPYEYTVSRVPESDNTPVSSFWVPDWERRLAPPRPSAAQTAADSGLSSAGRIASAVARAKGGGAVRDGGTAEDDLAAVIDEVASDNQGGDGGQRDGLANGHADVPPALSEEPLGPLIEVYGAEQLIRPTGLLDPEIEVKPTRGQIDDLMDQIGQRTARGERVLVTTLTKRMAEDLADFLREANIKVHYLHSEVDTLERVEILRDLRLGVYDVVVGINLLREGLDLPEVSLVAILDADKEGYLRSNSSLIQTIGRAARHVDGHVIMYADQLTESMRRAIDETYRRRAKQQAYNEAHGLTPIGIRKAIRDITERVRAVAKAHEATAGVTRAADLPKDEIYRLIKDLEAQMKEASRALEFERAALLRDQVIELRRTLAVEEPDRIVPREFVRPATRAK